MHTPLIVGRAPTCDLAVFDPTISRRHAELVCDEGGVSLRDLGSSNGTFVNGTRVQAVTVEVDDLVAFGKVAFRLESFVPQTPCTSIAAVPSAPLGATIVRQMSMRGDGRGALAPFDAPATAPGGLPRAI